ncbi:MAG: terminase large subunit, partial [Planctomycetota bacterium]
LVIDSDRGPVKLSEVQDPWQETDFLALDAGWQRAAGQKIAPDTISRGWLERPRGHAKSSDVMVMATWCLFASRKQISGVVAAVDRDQAKLDRDHVERLVRLNKWLQPILRVDQWKITNVKTGSTLEILASDVASSYGLLLDFAVCDEVSLWPKRDLFDSILSAVAKRSTCLLLCAGNAGFRDSWVWSLRESIRTDEAWFFSRLEGPIASWISESNLQEQRRLLPPVAYNRLWMNLWSSGGGDALMSEDIDAAFNPALSPMTYAPHWTFCAGVDLGLKRHCASVVVVAVPAGGRSGPIRLAHHKLWRPTPGGKVNTLEVERHLLDCIEKFDLERIAFDPWQMEHLAQRLEVLTDEHRRSAGRRFHQKPFMMEIPPTAANLRKTAGLTIEFFRDRRVQCYPCEPLRTDLRKLRCEEKSYGVRLVSPDDATGHGDTFSAFALALLVAHELAAEETATVGVGYSEPDLLQSLFNITPGEHLRPSAGYDRPDDELMLWAWRASKGLRAEHPYL